MQVTIDPNSGFCFGVVHAIGVAERELRKHPVLYCLGDIVHNNMEVSRLKTMGLAVITHDEMKDLHDCRVMIRAHGEPPSTYQLGLQNRIELIDASCPIVLKLQHDIHRGYLEMLGKSGQIVIYGREGHAEVNALKGQTNDTAIVIGDEDDLTTIDFARPVRFYSQTTKSVEGFHRIVKLIREQMELAANGQPVDFEWYETVCRQVSNRSAQLREFAARFDVVVFVSGLKSSNGMVLYQVCREANPRAHLVSVPGEISGAWFEKAENVGICGATSTPLWLMEEIAKTIEHINE